MPRVVTLGGGHGQAVMLSALRRLNVRVSAVVSVADDGGCSGLLRSRDGVPPPGDLRRCLTALAQRRDLGARFEARLRVANGESRSAGNLVLALAYERLGSLQAAVDWAAGLLDVQGRVLPASENAGTLVVYDAKGRVVEGESRIEGLGCSPMVALVHGNADANPEAIRAIVEADVLLVGPGSFFTSTLAAITTAGVAQACVESRCCFIANLAPEGEQTAGWSLEKYVRILRDHLTIASLGGEASIEVLVHHATGIEHWELGDGTSVTGAPVAQPDARVHDPELVAAALQHCYEFEAGPLETEALTEDSSAIQLFEQGLQAALERFA
jgi:uncharacterized cofD-like protein